MLSNLLQLSAFSPGSLLTCCFGISDGALQDVAVPSLGPRAGEGELNCGGGSLWEQEASPLLFSSLFVFFAQSLLMCGVWQGSPLSWDVKGVWELPWGGRTAAHWASCWSWLHGGTAAPIGGLLAAEQQGSQHRVQRGKPVLSHLCGLRFLHLSSSSSLYGSSVNLGILPQLDKELSGPALIRISTQIISWFSTNRLEMLLLRSKLKMSFWRKIVWSLICFHLYHDSSNRSLSSALLGQFCNKDSLSQSSNLSSLPEKFQFLICFPPSNWLLQCVCVTCEVVAVEVWSYSGARRKCGLCGFGLFFAYTLLLKSVFNTNS